MIPTTTSTPSKSRRRHGSASAFWSALTRNEGRDAGRSDEYANGKTARPRRYGALFTMRADAADIALTIMLLVTLYVTRALIARERFNATEGDLSARRPSVARRVGPTDAEEDDLSLARTVRFRNATVGNPRSPKSFYGRAARFAHEPGFPISPPLVLSSQTPKAYLMRNFLSTAECDHLMDLAKRQLEPSTVVADGGKSVASDIRTSAGMFLGKGQDKIVSAIEERIARLSGIPVENGEGMQILRYDKGQKYDPHYDYFHDKVNPSPKRGGQRVATVLIYLMDTEKGGETTFPNGRLPADFEADEPDNPFASSVEHTDCAKRGIPVKSVRGDAILFFSMTKDGVLDSGSLYVRLDTPTAARNDSLISERRLSLGHFSVP
jgi:hypothetical protein